MSLTPEREREIYDFAAKLMSAHDGNSKAARELQILLSEIDRLRAPWLCDCHTWPGPDEAHDYIVAVEAENERLREAGEALAEFISTVVREFVIDPSDEPECLARWREASSGAESLENAADENGDAQAAPTAPETIARVSRADLHRPLQR